MNSFSNHIKTDRLGLWVTDNCNLNSNESRFPKDDTFLL